jgi:hypothetical protein
MTAGIDFHWSPKVDGQSITFDEERRPCGTAGGLRPVYLARDFNRPAAGDLGDCRVSRPRAWQLVIWEPLPTKAPGPALAQPYCCYIQTVIFYYRGYVVRPPRGWRDPEGVFHRDGVGSFIQWDQVESRLTWDDVVEFEGEQFGIGGGRVRWARAKGDPARWWMVRGARRKTASVAA